MLTKPSCSIHGFVMPGPVDWWRGEDPWPPRLSSLSDILRMQALIRAFLRDEEGATTAEYGIIVLVMAAIGFAVSPLLSGSMDVLYGAANQRVGAASTYTP